MPNGCVVIVPGIGGNDLRTQPALFGLGPSLPLWLNLAALGSGGWRLMGLAPDGITPNVPLTGPLVPFEPLALYYSTLDQGLARRGWFVVGANLDWRQLMALDGERLATAIRQLRDSAPVHLVCHSRGGLVARHALALLRASGDLGLVGRVIGLGVPHYGSWTAAGLLGGWNQTAAGLALLLRDYPGWWIGADVLGTLQAVITTWPAAYELLPSPVASGVEPWEIGAVYSPESWSASGISISTHWLAAARAHWTQLPYSPPEVEWVDVFGWGLATPRNLVHPIRLASSGGWSWDNEGDGTVPAAWAVQGGRRTIRTPTSHGAMPYDGRVINAIHDYLVNGLNRDIVIEGQVLS